MKTVKNIIMMLVLLACTGIAKESYSQVTMNTRYFDQGKEYYCTFPDVDSTKTLYTKYFDWSDIDGYADLIYGTSSSVWTLAYTYTSTGGTSDSLNVTIQGEDGNGNVHDIATVLIRGSTNGASAWASIAYTAPQVLPNVRIKIAGATQTTANRNNAVVDLAIYAPRRDEAIPNGNIRW